MKRDHLVADTRTPNIVSAKLAKVLVHVFEITFLGLNSSNVLVWSYWTQCFVDTPYEGNTLHGGHVTSQGLNQSHMIVLELVIDWCNEKHEAILINDEVCNSIITDAVMC